jgi:hypothetical protein
MYYYYIERILPQSVIFPCQSFTIPSLDPQYSQNGHCQEKKVCVRHHIYSNARWGFFHKFGTLICEVILFCMWSAKPHHAELHHAKPNHSEPDHVEPNHGLHHQIMNFRSPLSNNGSTIHCTCLHSMHRDNIPVLHNYNTVWTVHFCITAMWGWKESPQLS